MKKQKILQEQMKVQQEKELENQKKARQLELKLLRRKKRKLKQTRKLAKRKRKEKKKRWRQQRKEEKLQRKMFRENARLGRQQQETAGGYSQRERKTVRPSDDLSLSSNEYNAKYLKEEKAKLTMPMLCRFETLAETLDDSLVQSTLSLVNLQYVQRPTFRATSAVAKEVAKEVAKSHQKHGAAEGHTVVERHDHYTRRCESHQLPQPPCRAAQCACPTKKVSQK